MIINEAIERDSIYEFFAKEIAYGRPDDYQSRRINYSHDYFIDVTKSQKNNAEWIRQLRYLFFPHTYTDAQGSFIGNHLSQAGLSYVESGLDTHMELDQGRGIDPRNLLLQEWGYTYYAVIDSPSDGFFAWIFQSNNSKPNILAIRGTEFNTTDSDSKSATYRDLISDLKDSIGINQYQAVRTQLETEMGQANSNGKGFIVTGHSLGGALAQHVLVGASKPVYDIIEEVVTFMSPGIGKKYVRKFEAIRKSRQKKQAARDKLEAETGVCSPDPPIHVAPAIRHHVNYGDVVDLAGLDRILDDQNQSIYQHYASIYYNPNKKWYNNNSTFGMAHSMGPHSLTSCATHPNIVTHNLVTDHLSVGGFNFRAIMNQRHKAQDFNFRSLSKIVGDIAGNFAKGAQYNPKFGTWMPPQGYPSTKRFSHHYEYASERKFKNIEWERLSADGYFAKKYLEYKLSD